MLVSVTFSPCSTSHGLGWYVDMASGFESFFLFLRSALVRSLFVFICTARALLLRYGFVDSCISSSSLRQYVHLLLPSDFVFACFSASFSHYPVAPAQFSRLSLDVAVTKYSSDMPVDRRHDIHLACAMSNASSSLQ